MMLFVAGLAGDFDDVDLKEMFELYGEVSSARLITDRATGKSKGFGFVDMPNEVEAKETITTLDGVMLQRKRISVKEAEAQQNRPAGGGGGYNSGGGFNNNRNFNSNSGGGYSSDRPRTPRFGNNNNRNNDNRDSRDNNPDRGGFNKRY